MPGSKAAAFDWQAESLASRLTGWLVRCARCRASSLRSPGCGGVVVCVFLLLWLLLVLLLPLLLMLLLAAVTVCDDGDRRQPET